MTGLACLLASCVQPAVTGNWRSPLHQGHTLVGEIWDSGSGRFVEQSELWDAIHGARYLLLGEKHDNPDHHALQLLTLESLLEQRLVQSVVLEMLDSSSSQALADLPRQQFNSIAAIKDYLNWDDEGWDWRYYGPLIEAAYSRRVSILPGNISSAEIAEVYAAETPAHLLGVLDAPGMEQLEQAIDQSHCGMLPESQFPAMVRVQQTRDFTMAAAMGQSRPAPGQSTVLIAGNYHIRQDLGVPNYLLAADADLQRQDILALAFMEVQAGVEDPAEYLQGYGGMAAYDYIWFTPAVTAEDYCASLLAP